MVGIYAPSKHTFNTTADKVLRLFAADLGRYSMQKSKKYVLLATYVIAVLCLAAGLFLPFYDGKNILALKLGDVFKSLLNKENGFGLAYPVSLFGIEKLHFDFMALVIVLYTAVTALSLLAFVPVALSVRKEGKLAKGFYYGIEATAIIILSLYLTVALINDNLNYNFVIALSGTVLALVALCGLDKGKNAALKIILFLLSAIGFLALFNIIALVLSDEAYKTFSENSKFNPFFAQTSIKDFSGAGALTSLFTAKFSETLAEFTELKFKTLMIMCEIASVIVLLNFFIDTVKLCTGKDGKVRNIFNIARYGIELIAAVCVLVMALVCKANIGIMLIVVLAVAGVQLAIAIVRFVFGLLKKPENKRVAEIHDEPVHEIDVIPEAINEEPVFVDSDGYSTVDLGDDYSDGDYTSPATDGDGYETPVEEVTQPIEEIPVEEEKQEVTEEVEEEIQPVEPPVIEDDYKTPEEDENDYVIEQQTEYIDEVTEEQKEEIIEEASEEEHTEEVEAQPEEEIKAEEIPEEVTEEIEQAEQPIEEPAEEAEEPVEVEQPVVEEEEATPPYREEIKPYNPYERHNNNPFRAYEQNSQPYNPYVPARTVQNTQTQYDKPVQPQPVHEAPKPVERPQTVRPLRPRPIIQEFKPVPPISEQPPKERQVYTIDTIYAGPTDDFIRKLSNDERIEFARTFIEKNRGDLGNIPDYKVGGDNKKFFSVAFIYLGRIRGLVSDGLLNKMYKELNML